ncbi:conserved protein of unknown function [Nitratireductor aquimarinus]|uniref:hypothetical protein n=1 Tax=Nitratireductor aquimarinus TaxID=889300 RepID=UPI003B594EEF
MAIILKKKKVGGSNKNQTLPKNDLVKGHNETSEQSCVAPFIDKLSVVIEPPAHMVHDVYEVLLETFFDPSSAYKEAGIGAKKGYRAARRIALDSLENAKKWPLIQANYDKKHKSVERIRLEFVPVDLKHQGLAELNHALLEILEGGWAAVVQHGRVTRIDIAVDLQDVLMDSFLTLPPQAISRTQWASNGQLQTIALGKSKGNQTLVYDRGAKRNAMGQAWKGISGVRVERRLVGQSFPLLTLSELANPFSSLKLVENLPPPPDGETQAKAPWQWLMFCDSVQVRGLSNALSLLPKDRRQRYKKHLAAHGKLWWQPDQIWSHWPTVAKELLAA